MSRRIYMAMILIAVNLKLAPLAFGGTVVSCRELFSKYAPEHLSQLEIAFRNGVRVHELRQKLRANESILRILEQNPQLKSADFIPYFTWTEIEEIARDRVVAKRILSMAVEAAGGRFEINQSAADYRLQYTIDGLQLYAKLLLARRDKIFFESISDEAKTFGMKSKSALATWRFDFREPIAIRGAGGFFPNSLKPDLYLPEHGLVSSDGSKRFVSVTMEQGNFEFVSGQLMRGNDVIQKRIFPPNSLSSVPNPDWPESALKEVSLLDPTLKVDEAASYFSVFEYEMSGVSGYLPLKLPGALVDHESELITDRVDASKITQYRKVYAIGFGSRSTGYNTKWLATPWMPFIKGEK